MGDRLDEIDFWKSITGKYGNKVLELGAGTGCFTIPLLLDGNLITAFDISAESLNHLQTKTETLEYGGELKIVHADMRDFYLADQFNICLASYSTFQYLLNRNEQGHCLEAIYKHLLPEGILCFDLDNDITCLPENMPLTKLYSEYNKEIQANITLFTSWNTDRKAGIRNWYDRYEVKYSAGRYIEFTNNISLKAVNLEEMTNLLEEAGFQIIETYGDYDFSEYSESTHRLIIIAQKTGA